MELILNTLAAFFAFKWYQFIILFLYIVPIFRFFIITIFKLSLNWPILNYITGLSEHFVSWFRDTFIVIYLAGFVIFNVSEAIVISDVKYFIGAFLGLGFILLSYVNYKSKKQCRIKFIEFVRTNPNIHPKDFYKNLVCCSGIFKNNFQPNFIKFIDPHDVNFTKKRSSNSNVIRLIIGVWSTIWLSKLSLLALKTKGEVYLREVASVLSVVWGVRFLQLANARLMVNGAEKLKDIRGYNIFLYNHASFFDFALSSLVVASSNFVNKKNKLCLQRFFVAKNHFIDNPIFYRFLGIGLVAEKLGMIFVKRKGDKQEAKKSIEQGAKRLVQDKVDLAIFPQGTRAYAKKDKNGKRIDSGYYTVGRFERLQQADSHLKKGAAHLTYNVLKNLKEEGKQGQVNLIPVGIKGAGIIVPRDAVKIQSNCTVIINIGEPIRINPNQVNLKKQEVVVNNIHLSIDNALKELIMVHSGLERRFFEDAKTIVDALQFEDLFAAMKQWRGNDYIVFALLDMIYTCKQNKWRPFLGRLIYLIQNDASKKDFLEFKKEIASLIR